MERLAELISKLKEQFEQNADNRQLLVITRMIEQELLRQHTPHHAGSSSSKIAVVMPAARNSQAPGNQYRQEVQATQFPVSPEGKPSVQPVNEEIYQKFRENAQPKETPVSSSPAKQEEARVTAEKFPGNGESRKSEPVINDKPSWNYDPLNDIPTLAQQELPKEINDAIATSTTSRNDQLKAEVLEVGHRLTDAPIRDLKKGIGVNDRYVFINELFRGDEVMYERSIKTINNFRIYAEAQYWIERELKVKLGWDDSKPSVKHFYQLVKRRFL